MTDATNTKSSPRRTFPGLRRRGASRGRRRGASAPAFDPCWLKGPRTSISARKPLAQLCHRRKNSLAIPGHFQPTRQAGGQTTVAHPSRCHLRRCRSLPESRGHVTLQVIEMLLVVSPERLPAARDREPDWVMKIPIHRAAHTHDAAGWGSAAPPIIRDSVVAAPMLAPPAGRADKAHVCRIPSSARNLCATGTPGTRYQKAIAKGLDRPEGDL